MGETGSDSARGGTRIRGLDLRCSQCGGELPLQHPHIVVERLDEDDNLICESCYESRIRRNSPVK